MIENNIILLYKLIPFLTKLFFFIWTYTKSPEKINYKQKKYRDFKVLPND